MSSSKSRRKKVKKRRERGYLGHPGAYHARLVPNARRDALGNLVKKEELVSNAPPEKKPCMVSGVDGYKRKISPRTIGHTF